MEVIKKPFECPNEDCSMSFTNEDHLSVHKKKHILSLSLTPTTPYKTLYDQTPTPTRFLNALDSAELFQDFHAENPFDATFRRANSTGSGTPNFNIPESSSLIASLPDTSEVLNTPSITLPSEPATPIILKSEFLRRQKSKDVIHTENADSLPFSPNDQQSLDQTSNEDASAAIVESTSIVATELNTICEDIPVVHKVVATKSSVVQTPVITSVGNNTASKSSATCVPTAVVTRQVTNVVPAPTQVSVVTEKPNEVKVVQQPQAAVVQSVCVTPMLQLMIRLPDGQTMPVQFPVMSAAPTVATVTQSVQPSQSVQQPQTVQQLKPVQPVQSSAAESSDSEIPAANILTKMRLKDMLKLNKKSLPIARKSPPSIVKTKLTAMTASELINEYGLSPPPSPVGTQKSGHTGRKRRDTIDDVDEKRKRSLERNRAAATRCREKRKQWITALERKAEELSATNTNLQHEVASLRKEVSDLKTLLLLHKDCPVTQQQKATNFDVDQETYASIQYVTSEEYQCVPNSSNVSPIEHAEYMEVEANSVQSSSDLSLTSDGSEVSFKER